MNRLKIKNMKILFVLMFFSINLIGQNFSFIDSVYLEYKKRGSFYYTNKIEPDDFLLLDSEYLRIATDESINKSLSDSLAITFKKRKIKSKKIIKDLEDYRDAIALDSNLNVLYVRVHTNGCKCMRSLYDLIIDDEEILGLLKTKKCKSIIANYFQIKGEVSTSIIFITLRFRSRSSQMFSITMPLK